MSCAGCQVSAARIAELEEELAAWRGEAADEASRLALMERADRVKRALRLTMGLALVTLCLVDRADRIVTRRQLLAAMRTCDSNLRPAEEIEDKVVDVHVMKIRRALKRHWARIETVWGVGYRMPADSARVVRALICEGAGS